MKTATRISQALTARGMTQDALITDLAPRLEARRIKGQSRPALWRYLTGEAEPSGPWLEEAAHVLGVRPEWLTSGDGPMTERELAVSPDSTSHAQEASEVEIDEQHKMAVERSRAISRVLGERIGAHAMMAAPVQLLVQRLVAASPDPEPPTVEQAEALANLVADVIQAPMVALAPLPPIPEVRSEPKWSNYVSAVVTAALQAIPSPGQGHTIGYQLKAHQKRKRGKQARD